MEQRLTWMAVKTMDTVKQGLIVVLVAFATSPLSGCGGGNPGGQTMTYPTPSQKASVNLLMSSTANAQLTAYTVTLTSITLTTASGSTVNVPTSVQNVELMHLNGAVEPVVSVEIPQDTYTSASVAVSNAGFRCFTVDSTSAITAAVFGPLPISPANVTVTVPRPITIAGSGTAILLNLLASQSATFSGCAAQTSQDWAVTPSFQLSAVDLSVQPTNISNGKIKNLDGQITAVSTNAGSFNMTAPDGVSWSVSTTGSTVFQGIEDLSGLLAGMAVELDAALQGDGTLLTTRVAVEDTNTTDVTLWRGPLLFVSNAEPVFLISPVEVGGALFSHPTITGPWQLDFSDARFQISTSLENLSGLPFNATFNATNMVAGQNVYVSTHAAQFPNSPNSPTATAITLLPQTLDGTITDISSQGGFITYTITLAAYDPFSLLASQSGQTKVLQTPQRVVVYTDGSTQMLNTTSPTLGSALRFNGLVFNDNGTLRMDAAEVLDGVTL
jgi:hypothetical protein